MTPFAGEDRLKSAPLGTKALAIDGGYWIRVVGGWQWAFSRGGIYPRPGADWDGNLIYPEPKPISARDKR